MSTTFAADPDFEARVTAAFGQQDVMKTIGAELTHVSPGTVEIEMPYARHLTQQNGFLHAGVTSTALDSACGLAALSLLKPEIGVLTIEFKVNLLAPARGERFIFRGSVTKPGRTILVADGQAYAFTPQGEAKMIATMTATLMAMAGRDGLEG